jgi:hypothetical protein
MRNDRAYLRLPGKRRTLGRRYTLWLGADHLLSVESTGYSEDYARFYFGDIRGVISRRTERRNVWSIFLALMAAILLVLALESASGLAISCAVLAGSFLLALLFNLLLGPTCVCHLLMPLGSQRLPALGREKQVAKLRKRIGPLVSAVQGTVSAEELAAGRIAEPVSPSPFANSAATAIPRTGSAQKNPEQESGYRGGAHWALFSLLIVDSGISMIQMTVSNHLVSIIASLLQLALFASTIIALVKQRGTRFPQAAKWLVWGALGTLSSSLFAFQIYGGIYAFSIARHAPKGRDLQQLMGEITAPGHPVVAGISGVYIVCAASLGILGLLTMLRWHKEGARAVRSPGA